MAQTFTHDGVVYEDLGDGNVRAIGYAASPAPAAPAMPQGFTIGSPNPVKQQTEVLQLDKLRADIGRQPAIADAELRGKQLANEKAARDLSAQSTVNLTAKERADAIAGYKSGAAVERLVADLERLYAEGPGATSGIKGLRDYLPTEINQRFDNAGNAARGNVGTALGFTGGQLNTATESAQSVGPYLPKASDRDGTIRDKIARLKQLAEDAKARSTQILGGVPDANGVVTPVTVAQEERKPIPGAVATGRLEAATGANRQERDPVASGIIDRIVRQGGNLDTLNTTLANLGYAPVEQKSFDAARQHFKQNPTYTGSYGDATRTVENTTRQQIAGSAPGAFAANAFNDVAAGIPGAIFGTDALEAQRRANPNAALAGSIVGGAIGSGALELGLGAGAARLGGGLASRFLVNPLTADALYGGIQGGATDGTVTGALAGAGLGAAGGAVGRGVVRGIGTAMRGVTDPAVQYLRSVGVPLTAGQVVSNGGFLGRTVKGIEDRLTGVPIVGDMINARRLEGLEGFNRAALNEAASPLSRQSTPINASITSTGPDGIEALRAVRSAGYDNAVNGRFASIDPQYTADYNAALTAAGAIPNTGSLVRSEIDSAVPGYFASGSITGKNAQGAIKELKGLRRARENDPLGFRTGQAVRQAEDAMTGLFERQSPGFANDLARANEVQTALKTIEAAASNGANQADQLFTPAQLNRASVQTANRLTGGGATSARPFYDLATSGQAVLPSKVPDSGTAGRLAVQGGLGGLGLGAAGLTGYAAGGTDGAQTAGATTLGLGTLLALGGTRAGQRAVTRTLLDRPDYLRRLGNEVIRRNRLGGMFGAGAALPLLTYD